MRHECPICLQKLSQRKTCLSHLRAKHGFSQEMSERVKIRVVKEEEMKAEEAQVQSVKNTSTVPDEKAVVPAQPEKRIQSSKICEYCDKGLLF